MLTEQVEQYTKEMEKSTFIIEDLKNELQRNKGNSMFYKYVVILDTIKFLKCFIFIKMELCYSNILLIFLYLNFIIFKKVLPDIINYFTCDTSVETCKWWQYFL